MDIRSIKGEWVGRNALINELAIKLAYHKQEKGRAPTRLIVDAHRLSPLFAMAKTSKIAIHNLTFDDIPVVTS